MYNRSATTFNVYFFYFNKPIFIQRGFILIDRYDAARSRDLITRIALRLTVFRWTNAQRDLEERRRESLLFFTRPRTGGGFCIILHGGEIAMLDLRMATARVRRMG